MKYSITCIIFLFSFCSFCQNKEKPIYYYDVDDTLISEKLFNKKQKYRKNQPRYLKIYFENDTAYIAKLHPRKKYGNLTIEQFLLVKNSLDSVQNSEKDFTLIQFSSRERSM